MWLLIRKGFMNKPLNYQELCGVLNGIHNSVTKADRMSTDQLATAVSELKLEGGEHISSLESAVKGEAIHRLNHPLTWRLRRWFNQIKRHAD